ncbi:MAG: hypothetical protein JXR97_16435 [Planctomycetes bacterium]|nr:hypothetical protein [Planctomycetota bacterium]
MLQSYKSVMINYGKSQLAVASALFVALSVFCAFTASGAGKTEKLVPANFNPVNDSLGYSWNLNNNGSIISGTNYAFSNAMQLQVNNNHFYSQQPQMLADGSEFILTGQVNGIMITRRIMIDKKAGTVRWVDVFENPTGAPMSMMVKYYSGFNGRYQSMVSDQGTNQPNTLSNKEEGFFVYQMPNNNRPSSLFWFGSAKSKLKPTIMSSNQYDVQVDYNLSIPAGKSAALIVGLAQRNAAMVPSGKQLDKLFKPFHSRKFTKGIPTGILRSIANHRGGGGATALDLSLDKLLEGLGVTRGKSDILAVGEETRLHGTASCVNASLETAYGTFSVPFEKIAAIIGGRLTGGSVRIFLRDGQAYVGGMTTEGFKFATTSGLSMNLDPKTLDRIVMRASPEDGVPPVNVTAFIETFEGDRIALAENNDLVFLFVTPWGPYNVPLRDLQVLRMPEDNRPGCRVTLKNGSRFFAFPGSEPIKVKTANFGIREFHLTGIRSITTVGGKVDEEGPGDISEPHVSLIGENVFVGRVDQPEINFVVGGELIPLTPGQIRTLHNMAEGDQTDPGEAVIYQAELWGGGAVSGELREPTLPVRAGGHLFRIPVRDIIEVVVPNPHVPEELRMKIAAFIRELGSPEWEIRESANQSLAELGFMAKVQLEEARNQTTDPEVKRRVEALLEEME